MTSTATAKATAPHSQTEITQPIFSTTILPPDGLTLNGEKYYTVAQISRHLGVGRNCLYLQAKTGRLKTVYRPGVQKKIMLVHEGELRRFLQG